jgi:anaerobic ribonucleoside-triphosphate reductase activating protein
MATTLPTCSAFKHTMKMSDNCILNLAMYQTGTTALGPGYRAAVWVQGCQRHCPGCIAPQWQSFDPAIRISAAKLARLMLADSAITGLTISGGEPMLQAECLAELIRHCRRIRDIDVICFSGYSLTELQNSPPNTGVSKLLNSIDVLIDCQYVQSQHADEGLRGSRNQGIHYLSDRLKNFDLESAPRKMEIYIRDGTLALIGIPTRKIYRKLTRGEWDAGLHGVQNYEQA